MWLVNIIIWIVFGCGAYLVYEFGTLYGATKMLVVAYAVNKDAYKDIHDALVEARDTFADEWDRECCNLVIKWTDKAITKYKEKCEIE